MIGPEPVRGRYRRRADLDLTATMADRTVAPEIVTLPRILLSLLTS